MTCGILMVIVLNVVVELNHIPVNDTRTVRLAGEEHSLILAEYVRIGNLLDVCEVS
jgi:hypothetical protein